MSDSPPNVNTLWGRVLVDELARAGLRHVAIAPGSRSTPLVAAFAGHPDVRDHSLIDERAAAFFALGVARATGEPAAVLTTSGTAAANLLPAVLEADRSAVPLILLTADRPPELRDAGESQSADQVKLFGERVRWFHLVAEPAAGDELLRYLRSTACEAWARASGAGGPPGPVHLDLPFRKPLAPLPAAAEEGALPVGFDPAGPGAAGRPGGAPWRRVALGRRAPDPAAVEELALALAGAERPLVLAGAMNLTDLGAESDLDLGVEAPTDSARPGAAGAGLRQALARLLAVLPLPVWAEATSQLRLTGRPAAAAGAAIGSASLLLGSEAFRRRAQPDLVLRLGEAPLDWPLRRFAARLAAAGVAQVAVDPWGRRRDPEHAVGRTLAADPALLLEAVASRLERGRPAAAADPGWLARHRAADRAALRALAAALGQPAEGPGEILDGSVLARLGRLLPEDAALVVSSSMALRELESFLATAEERVDVFSNRGLNGIDGVTSTALGVAEARRVAGESRTLLVTGDVAFAHDLSGALEAARSASDLVVVLLENGGGAIFDHLPGAAALGPAFERHFTTSPGIDFGAVARGLGWSHAAPATWAAFDEELAGAFRAPRERPHLIEVRTDRRRSRERRREVLEEVAEAVDRELADGAAAGGRGLAEAAAAIDREVADGAAAVDRGLAEGSLAVERPVDSALAAHSSGPGVAPARAADSDSAGSAAGLPVLLLHGFTGSGAAMAGLARPLRAAARPVLAPDLPGHGGAPVPAGGATLSAAVAAALAALDRRGLGRAHWVGYSLGGRVALAAALDHPERCASLVLLGATAGIEDEGARAKRRAADEALAGELEAGGLAAFVDRWMAQELFASQARLGHRGLRAARAERLRGSALGYAASLRGMGQGVQPSLWERLGEVTVPVLLVVGEGDEKYGEVARAMAERMAGARVVVVPGVGHAAHVEAPAEVGELVLEFLREAEEA